MSDWRGSTVKSTLCRRSSRVSGSPRVRVRGVGVERRVCWLRAKLLGSDRGDERAVLTADVKGAVRPAPRQLARSPHAALLRAYRIADPELLALCQPHRRLQSTWLVGGLSVALSKAKGVFLVAFLSGLVNIYKGAGRQVGQTSGRACGAGKRKSNMR